MGHFLKDISTEIYVAPKAPLSPPPSPAKKKQTQKTKQPTKNTKPQP